MTATPEFIRSNEMLSRNSSKLLIVDVQEKLLPFIPVGKQLVRNCRRLIEGAGILEVPVFATEQYPRGLGATTADLATLLPHRPEKLRFSSAEILQWGSAAAQADGRDKVVVAGIEAHVCILQTALDLLACGFQVYIPADAVASRHKLDWRIALERLSAAGAVLTTTESVLFEWCEAAGTPQFKEISRLVKEG
jgi:nicotinamidase-related amidase